MIPRSWLIIGAVGVVAVTNAGSVLVTRSYYLNAWEAEKANATNRALEETSEIEHQRAEESRQRDDRLRNMESEHEAEREKNRAAGADADRAWAERLRRIAASCHKPGVPSVAADAGSVPEAVASSGDRLLEEVRRSLREIGEGANELALRDKLCVATWAEVGR